MADEFKKKGVNVLLGPVVGPAWRVTLSGRNWEGFAADPYLSGSLAAQSVIGIQGQGVITSTKVRLPWHHGIVFDDPLLTSLARAALYRQRARDKQKPQRGCPVCVVQH